VAPAKRDPIPPPANDSLFRRARRMVSEGNGAAGRALVDSLLATLVLRLCGAGPSRRAA
jgi:hypothetical protein